ncbi:LuxR C-terminal-related transcriptional regulator [Gordonia sp. LSe1-13]|uniref:LuxR C-terminal-related transcriptional regulator n=1 Tax=Gordonia sesuvii TaxID=3116777 RepID=A0ABU7MKB7_9ACTN|nr:LuxR C-terminal-related transcriptional regulator [Gordonia sp. LSe1-13]
MLASHLAGRRGTIDQIRSALAAARRGDRGAPRTLVMTAGPGTGKSHTLHLLQSEIDSATRYARADDLSARHPFVVAAALIGTGLPFPVPDTFEDELYREVDSLCADGPLVLIVDDAHHADAATLDLLTRLAGATRDLPLVLLVGRRPLPERDVLTRLVARADVREWTLPPMTDAEITRLASGFLGAQPDRGLATALSAAGGNPMQAISMVRSLQQSGGVVVTGGRASIATDSADVAAGTRDAITQHLALLDGRARELTQKMAVWGRPATLGELAVLDGASPASLVGAAQSAIDAGIVAAGADGRLSFTHDLYADVTNQSLAPFLRSVLHEAAANHPAIRRNRQAVAHHRLAAGTDPDATLVAVRRAESELANTPAVAADLLEELAQQADGAPTPAGVHVSLAVALARTGRLARAATVAAEGLAVSTDIDEMADLTRIQLFVLIAKGDSARVNELIDETLALPVGDDVAETLTDLRRYVGLLDGATPVPDEPFFDIERDAGTRSVQGLIAESLRLFLIGQVEDGLRLALLASQRQNESQVAGGPANSSADIWPPLIGVYTRGPAAAADLLERAVRLRANQGTDWMTAYHELTQGSIDLGRGNLDDAAAAWDAGLERAAAADMGWTSQAHAGRAMVDVLRGDLATATTRLDGWDASGEPDQFGFPTALRAWALLHEARRKLKPAAGTAATAWDRAVSTRLYAWLPFVALDCARIATRAQDMALLEAVVAGLDAAPYPPTASARGPVALARARCLASLGRLDLADVITIAQRSADELREVSDGLLEACAWEEAACAAAALNDARAARDLAAKAFVLTQSMGAVTMSARIASRLRAHGVRMDPNAVRDRPTHGWPSLTETEVTVAELVATGLSGGEIADQLFISTRTVQTHVSHALAKLGLRTRVELAAYVASRP